MRVATGRLRSTLRSFGHIIRRDGTQRPAAELKWLGTLLGKARDGEVLAGHLQAGLRETPGALRPGLVGCSRLHLRVHSRYNIGMSTTTVGFAVADEDRDRLARLVEHFGGGNRSAYLRATLPVMESLARAERLRELQARNAERAAAAGHDYESLLAEIRQVYKGGKQER